jgi:hypothetical protein
LSEHDDLVGKLQEVRNSIKGLSLEIEGLRLNNNSTGDFILVALKDLLVSVNRMLDKVNANPN